MDNLNQRLVIRIGIAGLVPFILLTPICWLVHPDWLGYFIRAQLSYGIAILSFLGGLHWGVALLHGAKDEQETKKSLLWGVIPTLIAWCSMINMGVGFLVQIVGFIVAYQVDRRLYLGYAMPVWFIHLRLQLTRVMVGALLLTFIAANVRN
ncbi:MAG: DUF3429 domain-containing protein [Burkholderiales bacterium]|nr:DUF3429 domain-containing protein [Burkholderiales bacterium]